MTWGKIDDTLHAHRKARKAKLEALGLWAITLSHCAQHLTDGVIELDDLVHLAEGSEETATRLSGRLVEAVLWHPADAPCPRGHDHCDALRSTAGAFRFHDWTDHQPLRKDVEEERARKREAGRRGGVASAQARGVAGASPRPKARAAGPSEADPRGAREARARVPVPSRPARPARPARPSAAGGDPRAPVSPGGDPEPDAPRARDPEAASKLRALAASVGSPLPVAPRAKVLPLSTPPASEPDEEA